MLDYVSIHLLALSDPALCSADPPSPDGLAGSENVTGDEQKKLDVLSNEMMVNSLYNSHECAILVSEENEDPIIVEPALAGEQSFAICGCPSLPYPLLATNPPSGTGKYCVAFDPLDGSSNIDCNVSTGTIFAIWEKLTPFPATVEDILRPGNEIICAGYCNYGSATELVITYGHGVERFTLDPSIGEFILTGEKLKIPEKPKTIYSINEGKDGALACVFRALTPSNRQLHDLGPSDAICCGWLQVQHSSLHSTLCGIHGSGCPSHFAVSPSPTFRVE